MIRNSSGQAMVEAVAAFWLLFLFLVGIYYIFLKSIDKIRSLDTVYQLARAREVNPSPNDLLILLQCFPGRIGYVQTSAPHSSSGVSTQDVQFQFLPHSTQLLQQPWTSTMRIALPNADFLKSAWPGAAEDTSGGTTDLLADAAVLKLLVGPNQ